MYLFPAFLGVVASIQSRIVPSSSLVLCDQLTSNSLPNITVFGTGGTIAGSASSHTQTTGYIPGAIRVQALIDAVPSLESIANIDSQQISNIRSTDITSDLLLDLSRRISTTLESDHRQGVVVTHGTDTLEESAFFLSLTVQSKKPTILVGAIRPATALSADGPINLLQAVTLAAAENAVNRGPMIVLNDRISSGFYTTKSSTNAMDAFRAVDQGHLGYFDNSKPRFYYTPAQPTTKHHFDISNVKELPQVDIVYGHQGLNPNLILEIVKAGAKGIVLASMGNGGWTKDGTKTVNHIVAGGIPVVHSHRTQDGAVSISDAVAISSGLLSPEKSRILLQLAIASNCTSQMIKSIFEK